MIMSKYVTPKKHAYTLYNNHFIKGKRYAIRGSGMYKTSRGILLTYSGEGDRYMEACISNNIIGGNDYV